VTQYIIVGVTDWLDGSRTTHMVDDPTDDIRLARRLAYSYDPDHDDSRYATVLAHGQDGGTYGMVGEVVQTWAPGQSMMDDISTLPDDLRDAAVAALGDVADPNAEHINVALNTALRECGYALVEDANCWEYLVRLSSPVCTCPGCNYTWGPIRVAAPKSCPRCKRRLDAPAARVASI
jgi:hypothetical protein